MISGHVFIATSLDGYIARSDGSLDWLMPFNNENEDYGYTAFIQRIGAIIMGRGTYEAVRKLGFWHYTCPVIVMSRRLASQPVPAGLEEKVSFSDKSPEKVMKMLEDKGVCHAYVDGGLIIQSFLSLNLIEDMIISRVPVVLGSGIALFGEVEKDIPLKHVKTQEYSSGLVQSEYRVVTQ